MTVPTFPLARIRVTVWSVVAFFLAALALGAALLMQRMRQADLADSEAQVVHFVAGAEAALNRVLLGFDVLLASTDEMLGLSALEGRPLDAATASQLLCLLSMGSRLTQVRQGQLECLLWGRHAEVAGPLRRCKRLTHTGCWLYTVTKHTVNAVCK